MSILFNFEIRGTRLRSLFLFLSSIIQDKITTWHISKNEIRCSEISQNKRILFNYVLYSKNLVNYEYNFSEPVTKIRFELKWLNEKMQEVKIKNRIQFTIENETPDVLQVNIYGESKTKKDKKIKLSISPEMKLQEPPPNVYYENPITMHKEDFLPFLKIKPAMKSGKVVKEEIEVKIQSPNFLKFTRIANTSESEKFGVFKKDKPLFKETFYINEIKNIFKLHPSTVIFNIFQPKEEKMPLFVSGLAGDYGNWQVYIHPANIKPITETHV